MSSNPFEKYEKNIVDGSAREVLATQAAYGHGQDNTLPFFWRYVVLEVIFDPTTIDDKKKNYYREKYNVSNLKFASVLPRNAIIAKRVFTGNVTASEPAMFLFPFFPPALSLPVQPGEHVWAMFEHPTAKQNDLAFWFCRIVEPGFVEDVNHTHSPRTLEPSFNPGLKDVAEGTDDPIYEFRNGRPNERDGERYSAAETLSINDGDASAYEKLMTETEAGKLMQYESVPRFKKRPGELALEGTNNTLIVLGRDRTGPVAKYSDKDLEGKQVADGYPDDDTPVNKKGAGSIDLVVGRGQTTKTGGKVAKSKKVATKTEFLEEIGKSKKELVENEGDPDFKNDRSRILISQKTKPDINFKIDNIVISHTSQDEIKDSTDGSGAIVLKTDKIRMIARQDLVILVNGAKDTDRDENGNIVDKDVNPDDCSSITLKTNGDIVFTPSKTGLIRLGGDDATLSPLCTRVGNSQGMPGPVKTPSPIIDTMGGAQGQNDGLNGTFPTRVLLK